MRLSLGAMSASPWGYPESRGWVRSVPAGEIGDKVWFENLYIGSRRLVHPFPDTRERQVKVDEVTVLEAQVHPMRFGDELRSASGELTQVYRRADQPDGLIASRQ